MTELLDPQHLRTFLTVFRHRNVTRAAEELGLSQPAVSRQLQQLAAQLGVEIFERIGRTLHLTDAGRRLLGEAEDLLGRLERAAESVRGHQSSDRGRVRIGASTTPGLYLLPKVVGRFHQAHPDVDLSYTVENSLAIERKILCNDLDLGFVGGHLAGAHLHLEPFAEDEIVCFGPRSHPLARRRGFALDDLDGALWVVREKGSATRRLFELWAGESGYVIGRSIELRDPEAVKSLVRAGVGVSFLSTHALADEVSRKHLTRLSVKGMKLVRPVYHVRHVDKHLSPAMETLLGLVREEFGNG
jgi:DNA-binding transcriptional LysR family regulator